MNRKRKLRVFYKIATINLRKNSGIKENILGGAAALGLGFGLYNYMGDEEEAPPIVPVNEDIVYTDEPVQEGLVLIDYVIKPDDTIHDICLEKFPGQADRAMKYIIEINELTDKKIKDLRPGKIIKIPSDLDSFLDHFDLAENAKLKASDSIMEFIKIKEAGDDMLPLLEKKDIEEEGVMTIGYGHRLETSAENKEFEDQMDLLQKMGRKKRVLSPQDPIILEWLRRDIKEAEDKVKFKALPKLNQNQFDALV